ncbi:MAG: hypothetical protein AVDCRST_MAG31-2482, partial [uncultured Sphingomonas sp.]
ARAHLPPLAPARCRSPAEGGGADLLPYHRLSPRLDPGGDRGHRPDRRTPGLLLPRERGPGDLHLPRPTQCPRDRPAELDHRPQSPLLRVADGRAPDGAPDLCPLGRRRDGGSCRRGLPLPLALVWPPHRRALCPSPRRHAG